MERNTKRTWVQGLKTEVEKSESVVVATFKGLNAVEVVTLRNQAREGKTNVKVTQNRLAKIALGGTKYEALAPLFKGATLIAYAEDPIMAAKVIHGYASKNEKLVILGGAMGTEILDAAGVKRVALLPTLDEARAKICTVLTAPAAQLARVFKAYAEKA